MKKEILLKFVSILSIILLVSSPTMKAPAQIAQNVWPLTGTSWPDEVTSPFGPRVINSQYDLHSGVDFSTDGQTGKPVHAVHSGEVVYRQFHQTAGNMVMIRSSDNAYVSLYAHLQEFLCNLGSWVSTGDTIGLSGQTGNVTGPHLHFGHIPGPSASSPDRYHPFRILPYYGPGNPQFALPELGACSNPPGIGYAHQDITLAVNELDLYLIRVYVYHQNACERIDLDFEKKSNVLTQYNTFFLGQSYEVMTDLLPWSYWPNTSHTYEFTVVPANCHSFPNTQWLGIAAYDIHNNYNSLYNTTGTSPFSFVNYFLAEPRSDYVCLHINMFWSSTLKGINIYRAERENGAYGKINLDVIDLGQEDESQVDFYYYDRDVSFNKTYFYKMELVFADGSRLMVEDAVAKVYFSGPTHFALHQNYPNPFNSSTLITYDLNSERPTETTIKIYNILGQEVRTLVDCIESAGRFRVTWDGKNDVGEDVGSGIYFYVLKSDNKVKINKMTLIK